MKNTLLSLTALLVLLTGLYSCKKTNTEPTVQPNTLDTTSQVPLDFTISVNTRAGEQIVFTINRKFTTAKWDFGDGSPVLYTGPGVFSHVYASGTYVVTLVADNDSANPVKKQIVIKPYYDYSYHGVLVVNDTINFISQTYPINGNTYFWTFGDGATATTAHPYHVYTAEGQYTIKLKVNGDEAYNVSKTIKISKDPIHTHKVAGNKTFTNCIKVIRPVGAPIITKYLPDSVLDILFVNKLNLKLQWDNYIFSPGKSTGDVICFEKTFSGSQTINGIVPGSITYYIAADSTSYTNVTAGTIKGGSTGNVYDYTFTCNTP